MRDKLTLLTLLVVALTVACGGGGGSDDGTVAAAVPAAVVPGGGGGSTNLAASFNPQSPNPGAGSVAMLEGSAGGAVVTLNLNAYSAVDMYGASFDVSFDPSMATFNGFAAGNLLEQGGNSVSYQVTNPQPGRLVVGMSRTGGTPGADGTGILVKLTFTAMQPGTSTVAFQNMTLLDDQSPPQPIPGTSWFGGNLLAN